MIDLIIIMAIIATGLIYGCAINYKRELHRIRCQRSEYLRTKAMRFNSGSIQRVAHLNAASQLEAEFGAQSRPSK